MTPDPQPIPIKVTLKDYYDWIQAEGESAAAFVERIAFEAPSVLAPVTASRITMTWCANMVPQSHTWTKEPGESQQDFINRVALDIPVKLDNFPPTNDCD